MNPLHLDPKKLLGFKLISRGSPAVLSALSIKLGGKAGVKRVGKTSRLRPHG